MAMRKGLDAVIHECSCSLISIQAVTLRQDKANFEESDTLSNVISSLSLESTDGDLESLELSVLPETLERFRFPALVSQPVYAKRS